MITRCDHCGSRFQVSAELVNSQDPQVRCGECMTLFDARLNLFNEEEFRKASTQYKPVQRKTAAEAAGLVPDSVSDPVALEMADTVSSEHFYTPDGSADKLPGGAALGTIRGVTADVPPIVPAAYGGDAYGHGATPDINLSEHGSSTGSNEYLPYRPSEDAVSDLEFERTMATEPAVDDIRDNDRVDDYQRITSREASAKDRTTSDRTIGDRTTGDRTTGDRPLPERTLPIRPGSDRPAADDRFYDANDHDAKARKQRLSERERRAVEIEPARRLDDQQMRQLEEFKSRNKDRLRTEPADLDRNTNNKDPGEQYAFIPDDVLEQQSVYRDNGRRDEDMQFRSATPRFDTSLDRNTDVESPETSRSRHSVPPAQRSGPTTTATSSSEMSSTAAPSRIEDSISARSRPIPANEPTIDKPTNHEPAIDKQAMDIAAKDKVRAEHSNIQADNRPDSRYTASSSSAQEMRRYQQHRPSVEVSEYIEPIEVKTRQRTKRSIQPRVWLWIMGLIAALCLAIYVARDFVANMNLPEPFVSAFCGVTGCVPTDPKKDVSQLESMRTRMYAHPDVENALIISLDVVNHSIYKQPYPTLAIQLLNIEGVEVARRNFTPINYEVVGQEEIGYLVPGEPTRITIELVDNGLGATDLNLEFE